MKPLKFKRFLLAALLIASALSLAACSKPKPLQIPTPNGGTYNPLSPYQKGLAKKVKRAGGRVMKLGDDLLIVLPTDRFFSPQTTQIKPSKLSTMKRVALLTKSYGKRFSRASIRVSGFTDKVFDHKTRKAISLQYARVVSSYLWNANIPASRIFIKGYGARKSIASNRYPAGTAMNRRVEIRINPNK